MIPPSATSFCTALVLPSLIEAREAGLDVGAGTIERAKRYLRRCALPNGAYSYDLTPVDRLSGVEHINLVQGSLGRIQVCAENGRNTSVNGGTSRSSMVTSPCPVVVTA